VLLQLHGLFAARMSMAKSRHHKHGPIGDKPLPVVALSKSPPQYGIGRDEGLVGAACCARTMKAALALFGRAPGMSGAIGAYPGGVPLVAGSPPKRQRARHHST
jgi:hypothetical protein